MCGLDALKPTFSILPPHFTVSDPLNNEDIKEALECMYGPILERWSTTDRDPTGLLLRLLASVIYHFDWINSMSMVRTDHPFNTIPLMFKPDLVSRLKEMVTTNPSFILGEATGIPPHVEQTLKLQNVFNVANECLTLLKQQVADIKSISNHLLLILLKFIYKTNSF